MPEGNNDVKDINSMVSFDEEGDSEEKVEQETTSEESSTEQTKAPEATDKEEETDEEDASKDQEESESDETETAEESQKVSKADERKEQLNKEIRDLVTQRNTLKRDVELATYDNYRAATAEQLEQEGMDATEAKIESLRQEQQVAQYTQHVTELNSNLEVESMQVIHDFPVFDKDSPEYDKDFASKVNEQYMKVSGIQKDPRTGYIVQANVLPHEFYKSYADVYKMSLQRGEVRGKQSAAKENAAAETLSSGAPKAEKKDPLMEVLLKD
jgi:hypothetical protein